MNKHDKERWQSKPLILTCPESCPRCQGFMDYDFLLGFKCINCGYSTLAEAWKARTPSHQKSSTVKGQARQRKLKATRQRGGNGVINHARKG